MSILTKSIVIDGQRVVIDMSPEEAAEFEATRQQDLEVRRTLKEKKQSLLDRLGLTEEEAKLLLG